MAIKKSTTIKRTDGSYVRLSVLRFNTHGMLEVGTDLWKDSEDRTANPNEPLVNSWSYIITDETAKAKVQELLYQLAEYIPELAGGEKIIDTHIVEVNKMVLNLSVGETSNIVATVYPEDATDKSVLWFSDNEDIVKVTDGTTTAIGVGEATVTVKTVDRGKAATCKVVVNETEE